ncbi:MAG: hypothetical protein RLZZ326_319 [Planctomycetota bacterium]
MPGDFPGVHHRGLGIGRSELGRNNGSSLGLPEIPVRPCIITPLTRGGITTLALIAIRIQSPAPYLSPEKDSQRTRLQTGPHRTPRTEARDISSDLLPQGPCHAYVLSHLLRTTATVPSTPSDQERSTRFELPATSIPQFHWGFHLHFGWPPLSEETTLRSCALGPPARTEMKRHAAPVQFPRVAVHTYLSLRLYG